MIEEFEKQIAKYTGTRDAVLCSSGRAAVRYSLLALGIGHGDEVLVPDIACQELPITVFCTGAFPRFCDVDRRTLAISSVHFQKSLRPNTKAAILVHLHGLPGNPFEIQENVEKKGIALIDDAAQALGASVKGKKAGSFGKAGILNFNKFLNVKLGAAVTTNDEELAERIRSISQKYEVRSLFASTGYRMMELFGLKTEELTRVIFWGANSIRELSHAAIAPRYFQEIDGWVRVNPNVLELWRTDALSTTLINELIAHCDGRYWHNRKVEKMEICLLKKEFENLEKYLSDRRKIAHIYDELLVQRGFEKILPLTNSIPSYKSYPILFLDKIKLLKCANELRRSGFKIDYMYKPLHMSPFFGDLSGNSDFKESLYVSEHVLPLPIKLNMPLEKVREAASIVNRNS